MPDITIRELKVGEGATSAVVKIMAAVFDDKRQALLRGKPGWEKVVESLLCEYGGVVYVAEADDEVCGAVVLRAAEWHPGRRTASTVISQLGIIGSLAANRRLKRLVKGLPPLGDGEAMLDALGVGEEHRRKGAAFSLMKTGEEWAARQGKSAICLSVKADNHPALALYKKLGYEVAHPYSNLFGDNYYMKKSL